MKNEYNVSALYALAAKPKSEYTEKEVCISNELRRVNQSHKYEMRYAAQAAVRSRFFELHENVNKLKILHQSLGRNVDEHVTSISYFGSISLYLYSIYINFQALFYGSLPSKLVEEDNKLDCFNILAYHIFEPQFRTASRECKKYVRALETVKLKEGDRLPESFDARFSNYIMNLPAMKIADFLHFVYKQYAPKQNDIKVGMDSITLIINYMQNAEMNFSTYRDKDAPNVLNGEETVLMHAVQNGYINVCKALIVCGVNVNVKAEGLYHSNTALTIACDAGKIALVQILLNYGADPKIKDRNNKTVLENVNDKIESIKSEIQSSRSYGDREYLQCRVSMYKKIEILLKNTMEKQQVESRS